MTRCGYCAIDTDADTKYLPLQCRVCDKVFHLDCLQCERPPALYGDQLFDFCCSFCNPNGSDQWARLTLNWWGSNLVLLSFVLIVFLGFMLFI